jgi:sensor histidine kinase YesM
MTIASKKIRSKLKNKPRFNTWFIDYKFSSILFRLSLNVVITLIIVKLARVAFSELNFERQDNFWTYVRAIISFTILGELLIAMDIILEKVFPVSAKIMKRVIVQTLSAIVLIVLTYIMTVSINLTFIKAPKIVSYFGFTIGFGVVGFYSGGLLIMRMTEKWIQSQRQIDKMRQEKLQMDYNSLQDQLNPHFLFNNLSVLKSLIMFDKDTALKFTDDFTDVYRYVLKSKDERFVTFETELEFIKSYLGLHKERLGVGLVINYDIDDAGLNKNIAPLTLQLLVENAIKHNITSKENPLQLIIKASEQELVVENNLQLKESSYSTHTGLDNLIKRYDFLTKKGIEVWEDGNKFTVAVPLL